MTGPVEGNESTLPVAGYGLIGIADADESRAHQSEEQTCSVGTSGPGVFSDNFLDLLEMWPNPMGENILSLIPRAHYQAPGISLWFHFFPAELSAYWCLFFFFPNLIQGNKHLEFIRSLLIVHDPALTPVQPTFHRQPE